VDYDDIYEQLAKLEVRGELRLMALRQFLLGWRIELRDWKTLPAPPPDFQYITEAQFFTRKWNALQALVFLQETCNFPDDGCPCEIIVTGKHEFLRGGTSTEYARLWL
jgi:hypothetical protein